MSGHLEFEKPFVEIDDKVEELRLMSSKTNIDFSDEIARLEKKSQRLADAIFSSLTSWQITQLARHPMRPHTMDYIDRIFTDFQEIHGDRMYSDDQAIVAGLARLNGTGAVVIGHQKGRDTNSNIARNFGMPRPEGYRKAQRVARLAEQFSLPIFTFIDTPGAHPGVDAEERGQCEAISSSLYTFASLKTPVIASVIGEGGSGGALAIGIADHVVMLQYSVYSVISPEGCASILWKDSTRAQEAAQAMGMTAKTLKRNKLIDEIVEEPFGGAHRDYDEISKRLRDCLEKNLARISEMDRDGLLAARQKRLLSYGEFESAT